MSRIISPEVNRKLRMEYRMRFFSVLFFSLTIAVVAVLALVSSSYLLLSMYEKTYNNPESLQKIDEMVKSNEELNKRVNQISSLSKNVKKGSTEKIDVASTLIKYASGLISVNSIEVTPAEGKTKVVFSGMAQSRASLLEFEKKINQDSSFKEFVVPIDALTKQKDILINVTFYHYES